MAAPDAEIRSLIRRLAVGTKAGGIAWRAEHPLWFEVTAGAAKVVVRSEDKEGDHPYVFELRSEDDMTLARAETQVGEYYTDWESEIEELFKVARNSALGVDDAIKRLTSELDLPKDPGVPGESDDIPF